MMPALVLGSGRVSGPLFEYLHKQGILFTVVSCIAKELEGLRANYPSVQCHCIDVSDEEKLSSLITQHQLVINLLPCEFLELVARLCVKEVRPMISASYVSQEVEKLHQEARDAGVLLLCECGLDPGIDHMLAIQLIEQAKAKGGEITSFVSWCGGLPAPECRNNPLQYKFSWYPKGALELCQRDAEYRQEGQIVRIPGLEILNTAHPVEMAVSPDIKLEGFANVLSLHHIEAYGLQSVKNIFRGTLRYQGFSNAVQGLVQAGLFSNLPLPELQPDAKDISWKELLTCLVTEPENVQRLEDALLKKLENSTSRLETLKGLGLLSDMPVDKKETPFNALCSHLMHQLAFASDERDMVIMQLEVTVAMLEAEPHEEKIRTGLRVYGDVGGHSAMAKTVGYPIAILAEMILKGEIKRTGVVLPITEDIYQPVLSALPSLGIQILEFKNKKQ